MQAEEYLNEKVRPIFDSIIVKVILEKPNDPVRIILWKFKINFKKIPFIFDYLSKLSGKNISQNMEREELNNLRKQVKVLKKKVNKKIIKFYLKNKSTINMKKKFTVNQMMM